ncbi:hypothetical protein Q8F55_009198 [Vanrija albida]|uniref:Class II aldolase/adducin N-terminal domain-containing protein n=1 Tax=Vanrija albida TaxID=181172 RepID=A0ABR3PT07_9TREE
MATLYLDPPKPAAGEGDGKRVNKFTRPTPPPFTDDAQRARYQRGQLALAARIFSDAGWGVGHAIGLSARDAADPSVVWFVPRGRALNAVRSADLIGVDLAGNVVSGAGEPDGSYAPIHLAIYAARPDVHGVASGHTPHGRVFAQRAEAPKTLWQDSCIFHRRVGVLSFAGALNAAADPAPVAEAVKGDAVALVLANRGLLTASASIEGAVGLYLRLESLAHAQLLAEAAVRGRGGELIPVGEEEALFTQQNAGSAHQQWMMSLPHYTRLEKATGGPLVY